MNIFLSFSNSQINNNALKCRLQNRLFLCSKLLLFIATILTFDHRPVSKNSTSLNPVNPHSKGFEPLFKKYLQKPSRPQKIKISSTFGKTIFRKTSLLKPQNLQNPQRFPPNLGKSRLWNLIFRLTILAYLCKASQKRPKPFTGCRYRCFGYQVGLHNRQR